MYRFLFVFLVFIFCQSCIKANFTEKPIETPKPLAPINENINPLEGELEVYEIKEGDNLSAKLKKIFVYDVKNKKKNLNSLLIGKNSLIIFVKPGCIFCESMLAVMNSLKPKIKPDVYIAMEAQHATREQFLEKYNKNSSIKASWIYDKDGKFYSELGLSSFPHLVLVNKQLDVVRNQLGLVIPAKKEKLENEPFPVILQKLSEETVAWMQTL
jgi:thioredoxin-related protein